MAIIVFIPTPLRPAVSGEASVSLDYEGAVSGLLEQLVVSYPDIGKHLLDGQGNLRGFINLYVNDADIRDAQGQDTRLQSGDKVSIVPSIAGGLI